MVKSESANVQVNITDNSPEVLSALKTAVGRALWAVGAAAEGYAKQKAPVDTGRLRNSITHKEDASSSVIGTNVEYAAAQEFGTSRGIVGKHYLHDAAANHSDEYKQLIKDSLTNV